MVRTCIWRGLVLNVSENTTPNMGNGKLLTVGVNDIVKRRWMGCTIFPTVALFRGRISCESVMVHKSTVVYIA